MNDLQPADAVYHPETGRLHFWIAQPDGSALGATIGRETLHYCFGSAVDGGDAAAVYQCHRACIDAAVRKRRDAGGLEPIMLRESDFPKKASA